MAYEPTRWKSGDIVTSARLNKLENGVQDAGGLAVNAVYNESIHGYVLDKTWQEIYNALASGNSVCVIQDNSEAGGTLTVWCDLTVIAIPVDSEYRVGCDQGSTDFVCASPNDYPAHPRT